METFLRKITSRKFWAAVVNFVTQILIACNISDSEVAQVSAIIMAGAGVIAYIIGEGLTDAARENGKDYYYEMPSPESTAGGSLIGTQDPDMGDDGK